MPVDDGAGPRTETAVVTAESGTAAGDERKAGSGGIPIPRSVPVPTFYAATFALGVLIGMGIALYFRP